MHKIRVIIKIIHMNPKDNKVIIPIKIALFGESGVGKTSILTRYCQNVFDSDVKTTKIASFTKSVVCSSDKKTEIQLRIWDTAGQETYRSLASFYYKDADAVFLVYDVTNKESFDELSFWLNKVRLEAPSNCLIMILGNKCDCIGNQVIDQNLLDEFTKKNNLTSLAVSAKENINIKRAFESVILKKFPQFATDLGYEKVPAKNSVPGDPKKEQMQGTKLTKKTKNKNDSNCC